MSIVSLKDLYEIENLIFLSVEFDQIIKPSKFKSSHLYNVHFSSLPKHRGVYTSIWPILMGDDSAGVTFHEIDKGIDTGNIVKQSIFEIPKHYTSRDLYMRFMLEAESLVIECCKKAIELYPTPLRSILQNNDLGTYNSRQSIDFSKLDEFLVYTPERLDSYLRAFNFHEYQMPIIQGERIIGFNVLSSQSEVSSGNLKKMSTHRGLLTTTGNDVELLFDPYIILYKWARGERSLPSDFDFQEVLDIDKTEFNGWSALMMAAYYSNFEAIKVMISHGADIHQYNKRGTNVLMYARSGEDEQVFKYLLDLGCDPNHEDANGNSVIDYLKRDGQFKLLKFIK